MIFKLVPGVIRYFCFPERPMKGGDILDLQKEVGILEKGGVDLETGVYDPPCQLHSQAPPKILGRPLNLAPPQIYFFAQVPPPIVLVWNFQVSPLKLWGTATMPLHIQLCHIRNPRTLRNLDIFKSLSNMYNYQA